MALTQEQKQHIKEIVRKRRAKAREGMDKALTLTNEFVKEMNARKIDILHIDYHNTIYGMCSAIEMEGFEIALYPELENKVVLHDGEKGLVQEFKNVKDSIKTVIEWLNK